MGKQTWLKRALIFIFLFFISDLLISEALLIGLNRYFGLQSNAEILINGSSMSMAGFNKTNIEKATQRSVSFYSRNGVSLDDRTAMLKHYFHTTSKKTELVILEVNPLLFSKRFTAANVYVLFLPFMDDPSINQFVRSKTSNLDYLIRRIIRTSRYNLDLFSLSLKGYMGVYDNKKNQILDSNALLDLKNKVNTVPVEFNDDKIILFKNFIKIAAANSKKIILVNMPIYNVKMKTFKNEEYNDYISFMKQLSASQNDVLFLDLNQDQITSNPNLFSDPLHVNNQGQIKVTDALVKFISSNN